MKLGMFTKSALSLGTRRKLIVAQDLAVGFFAILDFPDIPSRIGAAGRDPETALQLLEGKLMEDAAEEMRKEGVV